MNGRPKLQQRPHELAVDRPEQHRAPIPDDDQQRDERAGEGAGDEPERAAVEVHDEDDAEHDRDGDVDERDGEESLRPLLERDRAPRCGS